jgi:hypothetical protein
MHGQGFEFSVVLPICTASDVVIYVAVGRDIGQIAQPRGKLDDEKGVAE